MSSAAAGSNPRKNRSNRGCSSRQRTAIAHCAPSWAAASTSANSVVATSAGELRFEVLADVSAHDALREGRSGWRMLTSSPLARARAEYRLSRERNGAIGGIKDFVPGLCRWRHWSSSQLSQWVRGWPTPAPVELLFRHKLRTPATSLVTAGSRRLTKCQSTFRDRHSTNGLPHHRVLREGWPGGRDHFRGSAAEDCDDPARVRTCRTTRSSSLTKPRRRRLRVLPLRRRPRSRGRQLRARQPRVRPRQLRVWQPRWWRSHAGRADSTRVQVFIQRGRTTSSTRWNTTRTGSPI